MNAKRLTHTQQGPEHRTTPEQTSQLPAGAVELEETVLKAVAGGRPPVWIWRWLPL